LPLRWEIRLNFKFQGAAASGAIDGLVELIKPAVAQSKGGAGDALENAIRKNVQIGVERLKELQPILAPRVKDGRLKIVGGVYDLRTGAVTMR
jgi:carbonic anhydrase